MSLNLKPVLNTQTDNEKLDVVNYNFDQIVNNGGGPIGAQGTIGHQGLSGLTGAQGTQGGIGPTGLQGYQGAASMDLWKTNTSGINDTLVPKHGTPTNPPSVMFGVDKLDPLYNAVFNEASVLMNRKSGAYGFNLELTDDQVTAADGNKIIYSLAKVGSISTFQMGFYNTSSGNTTNWKLYSDDFDFSDGTIHFANIGSNGFDVYVPATFRNSSTFNNTVKINSGNPGPNKILTSADSNGTVAWKNVSEIGGVVPVGTIVPILTAIFDDDTLFYKDAISNVLTAGQKLKIRHGAGQGSYNGWYLCNGQTWLDGTGNSKKVPDLCSFNYTIDDNSADTTAGGQFAASHDNPNYAIIGGADISVLADYTNPSTYTVTDTIDSSSAVIHTNVSGAPVYDLTKLVYIIYIGDGGWYWQDGGTGGGTTVNHTYYINKLYSSTNNTTSVNYATTPLSSYATSETSGTVVTLTVICTPSPGYAFTSSSSISLWNPTGGTLFGLVPDPSVTQSSSVLNPNGTITLTLTDSSYPAAADPVGSGLIIIGYATVASTPTAINIKRSVLGFSGNNVSPWTNQTVYINGAGNLSTASQLYGTSALNSSALTGWYAQEISSGSWCYRYWGAGTFGTVLMVGVPLSPGTWKDASVTDPTLFTYGGVGSFPNYGTISGYSACDYVASALNSSPFHPNTAKNIWMSIPQPSGMANWSECYVIADNHGGGVTSYDSVDFTNNGSGSGYLSYDACFGMFSYDHSLGKLTRIITSCTAVNGAYDTGNGTGDCTYSGTGPGGYSGMYSY